jgi:hypothetical protein
MATPTANLQQVSMLTEIVVRAGNARQPDARYILQKAYLAVDAAYPDTIGVSTLFRPGATLDDLAREGSFPNAKISYSIVGRIICWAHHRRTDHHRLRVRAVRHPDSNSARSPLACGRARRNGAAPVA